MSRSSYPLLTRLTLRTLPDKVDLLGSSGSFSIDSKRLGGRLVLIAPAELELYRFKPELLKGRGYELVFSCRPNDPAYAYCSILSSLGRVELIDCPWLEPRNGSHILDAASKPRFQLTKMRSMRITRSDQPHPLYRNY